ncbi:type 1 periplasmic binding fold superfamily protein [Flavicella sp.]|nr:type 1 periplasmic binding fold superfamily protein [Flavicella sp.]
MSNLRIFATVIFTTVLFVSCVNDSEPINEEEVITTMTVTLVPDGGGTEVVLSFQDLDGDGPDAPNVNVSGSLAPGATYNGNIVLLNETEIGGPEDITEEVKEEDLEHQFFYTIGTGLDVTTAYSEEPGTGLDSEGNFLGVKFTLTTGAESSGSLTFTLRHEPTKPNTGLVDAEGETDIEVAFDIEVVELG